MKKKKEKKEREREREREEEEQTTAVARRNHFIARDTFQNFFELSQPVTAESKLASRPREIYFIRQ